MLVKRVITGKLLVRRVKTGKKLVSRVISGKLSFRRVITSKFPIKRVITSKVTICQIAIVILNIELLVLIFFVAKFAFIYIKIKSTNKFGRYKLTQKYLLY